MASLRWGAVALVMALVWSGVSLALRLVVAVCWRSGAISWGADGRNMSGIAKGLASGSAKAGACNVDSGSRQGGCHCGRVRFAVACAEQIELYECNCSICSKTGYLHLIVPWHRFQLCRGAGVLTAYTFGTQIARHLFCRFCGVKSFYVPRSNPDGVSVNARCLDDFDLRRVKILPFDGKNWDAAPKLAGMLALGIGMFVTLPVSAIFLASMYRDMVAV